MLTLWIGGIQTITGVQDIYCLADVHYLVVIAELPLDSMRDATTAIVRYCTKLQLEVDTVPYYS